MRPKKVRYKISKGMKKTYNQKHADWEIFRNSEIRKFFACNNNITQTAYHFNLSRQAIYPILSKFYKLSTDEIKQAIDKKIN
jgi:hypothetical protein